MPNYREELQRIKLFGKPPKEKKNYRIPKKSAKKLAEEKAEKDSRVGGESDVDKFFIEARKVMKGVCVECGGKTEKDNDKFYRHSIAHILPKRDNMFPSVATNDLNWVELCFWGSSCHSRYDSSWEKASQMKVWSHVIQIFPLLYPLLTREEKAKLPEIILQELEPKN